MAKKEIDSTRITLWGIEDELESLEQLVAMEGGEITPEYEKLELEVQALLRDKVDSCTGWLDMERNNIEAAKTRIKSLQEYTKVKENKINRFENFIKSCLSRSDKKTYQGNFTEIKFRKPTKVVIIDNEDLIPMQFQKVETVITVKKAEIKKVLQKGEIVEGAHLKTNEPNLIIGLKKGAIKNE